MSKYANTAVAPGTKAHHPGEGRTCGDCGRGEWSRSDANRTLDGTPFVKVCEHSHWSVNARGEHVCLRYTQACTYWVPNKTD